MGKIMNSPKGVNTGRFLYVHATATHTGFELQTFQSFYIMLNYAHNTSPGWQIK